MKNTAYSLINDVRIYGKSLGTLNVGDVDDIFLLNPSIEPHILRHYRNIPDEYLAHLRANGITDEEIGAALVTAGSKFEGELRSEQIETPRALFNRARKELVSILASTDVVLREKPEGALITYSFATTESVGKLSLISINELNQEDREAIVTEPRGTLAGDELRLKCLWHSNYDKVPAHRITVEAIMDPISHMLKSFTAYPGSYAPDYPSTLQSNEEYEYNASFWDSHVFVN